MAMLGNQVLLCLLVIGGLERQSFDPHKEVYKKITSTFLNQWDVGIRAHIKSICITIDEKSGVIRAEPLLGMRENGSPFPVFDAAQRVANLILIRSLTAENGSHIRVATDGIGLIFTPCEK